VTTRVRYFVPKCTQPPSPSRSFDSDGIGLAEIVWPCAGTRFRAKRCE
jgi:hypothetical protein